MAPGLMKTALAALALSSRWIRAEDAELSMGEVYHGMLDADEDGRVNKPELDHFVREMLKMSGAPHLSKDPDLEPVLTEAWRMSDENEDGDLSEKEAGNTNAELNRMVGAFMADKLRGDLDRDGIDDLTGDRLTLRGRVDAQGYIIHES
mmetsp:Transcript_2278/g.5371  ORF Transcript_2278/g.5371 Transcript_2278/m.5371 type:complete len:149 (+) Transcript_2278:235-681(+)